MRGGWEPVAGPKLTWLAAAYSLAVATALGVATRFLLLVAHVP
jgi:hypothetical protein